jgi:hypothetical protein
MADGLAGGLGPSTYHVLLARAAGASTRNKAISSNLGSFNGILLSDFMGFLLAS